MDQLSNMPTASKGSYFVVDFALVLFVTVIATVLLGKSGWLKIDMLLSTALMLCPAFLMLAFRFVQNRVISWGAVAVGCIVLLFLWFIQSLGSAFNGM